jgi:hypothetical protein
LAVGKEQRRNRARGNRRRKLLQKEHQGTPEEREPVHILTNITILSTCFLLVIYMAYTWNLKMEAYIPPKCH